MKPNRRNTFGFEIEIEGIYGVHRSSIRSLEESGYKITEDGSLRNNGVEIVSPVFVGIPKLKIEYLKCLKYLKDKGHFSHRCGVHIHVGTFELEDLKGLIEAYLPYEKELFEIFPNRKGNNFCIPIMDTDDTIYQIGELLREDTKQAATILCKDWGKYSAMNITPMLTQKTIEFRVASGSFNHKKVFKMIDIIEAILDTFYGREPKIKPKEENILEAKEYLRMCGEIYNEDEVYIDQEFKNEAKKLLLNGEYKAEAKAETDEELINRIFMECMGG